MKLKAAGSAKSFLAQTGVVARQVFNQIRINVIPAQAGIHSLRVFSHTNLMTIRLFYTSYADIYWISACTSDDNGELKKSHATIPLDQESIILDKKILSPSSG
jgi:hypothetical protein